jgi:hypothetical protein
MEAVAKRHMLTVVEGTGTQIPNRSDRAKRRMDISVPAVRNPDGQCGFKWPEKYPRRGI